MLRDPPVPFWPVWKQGLWYVAQLYHQLPANDQTFYMQQALSGAMRMTSPDAVKARMERTRAACASSSSGDTGHALGMSWLAGACFRAWQELVGGVGRLCVIVRMAHHLEDGLFSAASDDGFISPSVAIDDSILEPKTAVAAVDHLRLYDERCRSAVRFGSGFSAASLADIKSASESKDRSRGCGLSLLPTRNLDDDTQGVLKKGTYEERIANRTTMEAKRDCILAAIAAKAKMPESLKDAKKILRWLKKHIAKENEALDNNRQQYTRPPSRRLPHIHNQDT